MAAFINLHKDRECWKRTMHPGTDLVARQTMTCIDRQRKFDIHELFFSTTDPKGVIRSGNDVFVRVSGYKHDELIGKAHSLIRHPDMPHCVFQLLWDTILDDQPIVAYVNNRAKTGEYYWVLAMIEPIEDGFLSIRLKPSCGLLSTVQDVYREVYEVEQNARREGSDKAEIIAIGTTSLLGKLSKLGFDDYPSFMRHAMACEMSSRAAVVGSSNNHGSAGYCGGHVQEMVQTNNRADASLHSMICQIANLQAANGMLLGFAEELLEQSDQISVVATNAKISANTPTLEAISEALAAAESDNREVIAEISTEVKILVDTLDRLAFHVSVTALQVEICSHLLGQIARSEMNPSHDNASASALKDMTTLIDKSGRQVIELNRTVTDASQWFSTLSRLIEVLHRNAKSIRFVRMAGVKESVQLPNKHAFRGLFNDVGANIAETLQSCSSIRWQMKSSRDIVDNIVAKQPMLMADSCRMQELCGGLVSDTTGTEETEAVHAAF